VSVAAQLPEPGRFWIRYVPKAWEPPERPWINLATGSLGDWGRNPKAARADLAALAETPLDDVLYLPPVPPRRASARDELARSRLVGGTPVLVQLLPGEETTVPAVAGVAFVFDLLHTLLERDLGALRRLPTGATAAWPLLAGLTDDPALWELACRDLAAAGVRCVQAVTPALTPADRRKLAERWGKEEETFEALFHREPAPERDFARAARRHGLEPFLPRPLPRPPVLGAANRRIAGGLALAAEIWLRLGHPVETGQALYRDARWTDRTNYDLEALAREGNLGVLPFDPLSREIAAGLADTGDSERLDDLLEEYVA
jgi:voltage-gated potassium channel Kch